MKQICVVTGGGSGMGLETAKHHFSGYVYLKKYIFSTAF